MLCLIALFLLLLTSTSFLPKLLLGILENPYSTISDFELAKFTDYDSVHIVVLASGYSPDKRINSALGQLDNSSIARLVEGVRIHRKLPNSTLIFSAGPAKGDSVSQAEVSAKSAIELGVNPDKLMLMQNPTNTMEEAAAYLKLFGNQRPLILVTSAYHMNRALMLFNFLNLHPFPAPVDFAFKQNPHDHSFHLTPSITNITRTQLAIHEFLGHFWARLRNGSNKSLILKY
jgi:uncharacterized SAM-binding protein YcdF (DUF218 family)